MKHIYILLSVLTLFSCARTEKQDLQVTQINIDAPNPESLIEDLVQLDSLKAIKLEVSDASLLARINKVLIYKDRIYVKDGSVGKSVMIFDINGKFISKPTKMGAGPMEHLSIRDFQIDKRADQLLVLDMMRASILYYTLDGEYLSTKKIGISANYFSIMENGNYVFGLEEYASKEMFKDDEYYKVVVTDSEFKILDKFYNVAQSKGMTISTSERLSESKDGEILFSPVYRDTIYSLKDGRFSPKYALNYSFGKKIPDEEIKKFTDPYKYLDIIKAGDHVHFDSKFYENTANTYFGVQYLTRSNGAYSVFLDKKTGNVKTFYARTEKIPEMYKMLFADVVGTYNDYFIGVFNYIDLIDKKDMSLHSYPQEFKNTILQTTDEDNPLLILYKLKEF